MWADAVFEGGGMKGIGLVGALSVAENQRLSAGKSGRFFSWFDYRHHACFRLYSQRDG